MDAVGTSKRCHLGLTQGHSVSVFLQPPRRRYSLRPKCCCETIYRSCWQPVGSTVVPEETERHAIVKLAFSIERRHRDGLPLLCNTKLLVISIRPAWFTRYCRCTGLLLR